MQYYKAPVDDALFILDNVLDIENAFKDIPECEAATPELCQTVLQEAGKLAENVFAPINASGDQQGCQYSPDDQSVTTPEGFKEAYKAFIEGGWGSLSSPEEFGGQGLPSILSVVLDEIFSSSNISLSMYSGLTHGAIVALEHYAADALKERYLEPLITGRYTGTMCLTEAHCGTDLGLLKTKAIPKPDADGTYLLTGNKIWITGGEHDLSENIIHLVLAKLPDAPAGSKGISLFLVPKLLPDNRRNPIVCTGLEHKMGINGSATCFMSMEDAEGWLIGEPHNGLKYMFAMMNSARLMVGMQGLGLAEAAYQTALTFAKDRRQGRAPTGAQEPEQAADCILVHADVRRMLLTQKVMIEGCRTLAYWVGLHADLAENSPNDSQKALSANRVALLTPVVKAFLTDQGYLSCDLAVQSMGGSGYTQDWGVEQFLRDARIARIYEGTNGIQALDLVGRKLPMQGGEPIKQLMAEISEFITQHPQAPHLNALSDAMDILKQALTWLMMEGMKNKNQAVAAATPFLKLLGLTLLGYLWCKSSVIAQELLEKQDPRTGLLNGKIKSCDFYFAQCLPEIHALWQVIQAGDESLMAFADDEF